MSQREHSPFVCPAVDWRHVCARRGIVSARSASIGIRAACLRAQGYRASRGERSEGGCFVYIVVAMGDRRGRRIGRRSAVLCLVRKVTCVVAGGGISCGFPAPALPAPQGGERPPGDPTTASPRGLREHGLSIRLAQTYVDFPHKSDLVLQFVGHRLGLRSCSGRTMPKGKTAWVSGPRRPRSFDCESGDQPDPSPGLVLSMLFFHGWHVRTRMPSAFRRVVTYVEIRHGKMLRATGFAHCSGGGGCEFL